MLEAVYEGLPDVFAWALEQRGSSAIDTIEDFRGTANSQQVAVTNSVVCHDFLSDGWWVGFGKFRN
jgi:hypothetical protein